MQILKNTTSVSDSEILRQAEVHNETFDGIGLVATGPVAYGMRDGQLVQGGELRLSDIIINHP